VSHDDDAKKALERVQKLLLIAVQSSHEEEQRTAAHECCRLVDVHERAECSATITATEHPFERFESIDSSTVAGDVSVHGYAGPK
jgi:hypothetical protein